MRFKALVSISAAGFLSALAMPLELTAQDSPSALYTLSDLGPVGPAGQPFNITRNGLISGAAAAPDGSEHAVLWFNGVKVDIGTPGLGGANSMAFGVNVRGQAVGGASTSTPDPEGEDYCGFGALGLPSAGTTCLPFVWEEGAMTSLPTLGGNNGVANMINSRGRVVGAAETSERDTACPGPQTLHFEAATWEEGEITELPPLSGDADGVAFAVNNAGQAAGVSGDCSTFNYQLLTPIAPRHALLWQNGVPIDLGNLGGTGHGNGNVALSLNNRGQVVGSSDLPGDTTFHAFLWTSRTGMQDLGTLPGDIASGALSINDEGTVTGVSLDGSFNPRAFVLRNGVMTDLNSLVPAGSTLYLLLACSINSRGEIIGLAVDTATGELHGYLATPADR